MPLEIWRFKACYTVSGSIAQKLWLKTLPRSHRRIHSSWTNSLKTHLLVADEAPWYQSWITVTIRASCFALTIIWMHVASSFWCVFSISKPGKAFHNAAIWGQCWPSRSQHRQMGYIHASGGRGRERKCRKKNNEKIDETTEGKEECKSEREPDRRKKTQRRSGWMQGRWWFYNYTSFTDQHCMYNWKTKSALSLSGCTRTHVLLDTWLLWPI